MRHTLCTLLPSEDVLFDFIYHRDKKETFGIRGTINFSKLAILLHVPKVHNCSSFTKDKRAAKNHNHRSRQVTVTVLGET